MIPSGKIQVYELKDGAIYKAYHLVYAKLEYALGAIKRILKRDPNRKLWIGAHKDTCYIPIPDSCVKKIVNLGNASLAVVLPMAWLREMKISHETSPYLKLTYSGNSITFTKA